MVRFMQLVSCLFVLMSMSLTSIAQGYMCPGAFPIPVTAAEPVFTPGGIGTSAGAATGGGLGTPIGLGTPAPLLPPVPIPASPSRGGTTPGRGLRAVRPAPPVPFRGAIAEKPSHRRRSAATRGYSQADWRHWWNLNAAHYMDLGTRHNNQVAYRGPVSDRNAVAHLDSAAQPLTPRRLTVVETALPRLRELLNHESSLVRSEACIALGRSGEASDFSRLMALVKDKDLFVRRAAIYSMGLLGNDAAVVPCAFVLKDSSADGEEQIAAALALGLLGSAKAADALQALISRKLVYLHVRAAAIHALGRVNTPKARVFLKHFCLRSVLDHNLRAVALSSLAQHGGSEAVGILIEALGHDSITVRRAAALAMGTAASKNASLEASRALQTTALADSDMTVRSYAALSLGEIGEKGGLKAVSDAFKRSKSRTFQAHAALALGIARESGSGPLLLKTLKRRALDDTTRAAVVLSAGLGDHQVVATRVAHEFKTRTDASTCSAASISMALLGDRNEIPRLRRTILGSRSPELKPSFGAALGLLRDAKTVAALSKILVSRRSVKSRIQSAQALGTMRDIGCLSELLTATQLRRQNVRVLSASVNAIGRVTERGRRPIAVDFYRHVDYTSGIGRLMEFAAL